MAAPTRTALLDAAEDLVRQRGYDAFSYADLAEAVGIRKPSIHHHFPRKSDLAVAILIRYRGRFESALAAIDANGGLASDRLESYVGIYRAAIRGGGADADGGLISGPTATAPGRSMCLCVSLGLARHRVDEGICEQLRSFHRHSVAWLRKLSLAGTQDGSLASNPDPNAWAHGVLASMQGSQVSARLAGGRRAFDLVAREVLRQAARP